MLSARRARTWASIDAPDERAAIAKVAQIHSIPRALPNKIVATRLDAKR